MTMTVGLGRSRTAVARAASANFGGSIATAFAGAGIVVIASRNLGAGQAGVLFEAVAVFTILTLLMEAGAPSAVVRMCARQEPLTRSTLMPIVRAALGVPLGLSIVAGLLLLGFADELGHVLAGSRGGQLATYLRFAGAALPLAVAGDIAYGCLRGIGAR